MLRIVSHDDGTLPHGRVSAFSHPLSSKTEPKFALSSNYYESASAASYLLSEMSLFKVEICPVAMTDVVMTIVTDGTSLFIIAH
jgi:hypothetical protein